MLQGRLWRGTASEIALRYVCMYLCVYVCMYIYIDAHNVCVCIYVDVRMMMLVHMRMYYMHTVRHCVWRDTASGTAYVCMYVYICILMCI